MSLLRNIFLGLRGLFHKERAEKELDEELSDYLEMAAKEKIKSGLSRGEAIRKARIEMGSPEAVKEEVRAVGWEAIVETVWQDIRYSARMLRKNPGFTTVTILTLALGIGANTAIFSVIHAVLLRPLPFKDPDHLVLLTEYNPGKVDKVGAPRVRYLAWKNQNTVFEETAAYWNVRGWDGIVLGGTTSAERVRSTIVSNSFFSILGVTPALGRGFLADEEKPNGPHVFLISDALWHRNFGASPQAIGKTFRLDGSLYTLAGVMPPEFQFPDKCDIWVSLSAAGDYGLTDRVSHQYWVLARLRPGTTVQRAQAEMDGIEAQLGQAYPNTDANWRVRVTPLLNEFVGNIRLSLFVLFGAVLFILLIACANVVNLLLARAVMREREFAIRTALGASRARLLRQTLTESLLIVSVSTVLALLLAQWGLRAIVALSAGAIQRLDQFQLNGPVLAFAAGLILLTTLLVGLAPAFQGSQLNFQESLREGQRSGTESKRGQQLRSALVISEVALTVLLLCGAGLMLKSFLHLSKVNPGFQPENVLTMKIALPDSAYPKTEQRKDFLDSLLEKVRSLPGVKAVAATSVLPLSGDSGWESINIVGRPILDWAHALAVEQRSISSDYFRAMGIPLLRGREFRTGDPHDASDAVIVNETMATRFWPDSDAIGHQVMTLDEQPHSRAIIGIIGNVKAFSLDSQSEPEMYMPYGWWNSMTLVLRSTSNPASLVSAVHTQIAALDKDVPVYQVAAMDHWLAQSVAPWRFNLFLLALFAALALSLAAVGIYGLLAFGVSQRRREIGVRLALGAHPRGILRLIVGQGMRLVLIGLMIGVLSSLALTRLMANLLYGVRPTDPLTFAGVAGLLALVAFTACYIPARRATLVDPIVVLHYE